MEKSYQSTGGTTSSRTERTQSPSKCVEVRTQRTLSYSKGSSSSFFKSFALALAMLVVGIGSVWGQVSAAMPANGAASSNFSNPFGGATNYSDLRYNFILLASDLTTGGLVTNDILTSIRFQISTTPGTTKTYNGLTISLKHTSATTLAAFDGTSLTTVYPAANTTINATAGWRNFGFTNNFTWNGTSNILVSVCWDNATSSAGIILNGRTSVGTARAWFIQATTGTGCSLTGGAVSVNVPVTSFRLLPRISSFTPSSLCGGQTVTITGTKLTGATAVTVGGTAVTSFTVDSDTQITAVVGSGTTGTISVTTQGGTGTSATNLTVNGAPSASTAGAATSLTTSGFTANWQTVSGATSYILDVSTVNTFASFVTGYTALNVGNFLIKNVTGLSSSTTYYYRVRATNGTCESPNSSIITAVTMTPACSGTPAPGNTNTSSASVTSGNTVNLSLQNAISGTGVSYQWQSGPSNTGPWTTFGATSATQTSAALTSTTWFKCNVTCGANTGASTPVQVTVTVVNTIPYTGSASVTCGTSTLIYDHGGSAGDYLDNANGYIVLNNAAGSTAVISLTGTYNTEGSYDYLQIYDGIGTGGTLLASYSGSGTITPFTSTAGQTITVQFQSDASQVYSGISLNAVYSGSCAVPACSGTPAPGTTVTSSATVAAPSGTVNLSLSTPPTGSGLSYQWQSGPSNTGPWTNVGTSVATYSPTVSATTWYQCLVTCSGSTGTSTPVQVSLVTCLPDYTGYSTTTQNGTEGTVDGDMITRVKITLGATSLLDNSSTATPATAQYTYYSALSQITMYPSNTYSVQITAGSYTNQNFAVWIDYNDDNDFNDANELIGYSSTATTVANETVTFSINLACTPPLGSHRMRVRDVYATAGNTIDPCTTYGWGETEDYLITIVAGTAFTPTFTATPTTPNCVGTQVTYTATAGQTSYDWGFPGTAGVDYTLVSGGTATSNTAVVTYTTSGSKIITLNYASPLGCTSSGAINNTIALGIGTISTTPNNGDIVWRGSSSTDWATPSNWYTYNSGSYSVAGAAPNNNTSLIIPVNTCVTQQPTIAAAGTVNAKDVVIETGAALTMTTGTLNVAGNFTNSGTFTPGTGTVNFMLNGTQTVTIGSSSFYNVGINLGLLPSVVPKVQLTGNTTINGDYTNTSGSLNLNSFDLTIGGNYLNSVSNTGLEDGLIPGTGNVIFNKASGIQTLSQAQGLDFRHIKHTGAGTLQLLSDISTVGNIINSAGIFDGNDKIITVGNNFNNTAIFTSGAGTTGEIYLTKIGGTQTLTAGTAVFQKFTHNGTGTLNLSGIVEVKGDVVIDAPISAGTSTLKLSGTGNQMISGEQSVIALKHMTIEKTTAAGTVTLSKPVKVDGTLTMTRGNIITSLANKLEIGSSTSSLGLVDWTDGNVVGPMRRWFAGVANSGAPTGIFPVGLSNVNRYAQINFTAAPGSGGYIDMEYKAGVPTTQTPWTYLNTPDGQLIQTFENEGYWDITPYDASGDDYPLGSGLNTSAFTMKLRAKGLTSVNDITITRIIRSPGPLHTTWEPAGFHLATTGTSSDFAIESNTITGFSWFNIGSPNNNALPVELLNFNGTCNEGMVDLVWQTASEFNSSHFDVEKSTDGETWRVLATIPSAGTSNELLTYQTVDNNGTSGSNYYRLRQVDIDGKEKLYDPINVSCAETTVGYFTSYPNPSGNEFQVVVNNKEILGACTLNIVDAQGKVIDQRKIEVKDGINMFVISEKLNPGIYFLNITNGTKTTQVIKHAVK